MMVCSEGGGNWGNGGGRVRVFEGLMKEGGGLWVEYNQNFLGFESE